MDSISNAVLFGFATVACLAIGFAFVKILFWFRRRSGRQRLPVGKVNLIIGDTFPPGALIFKPNSKIERTADAQEAQHRWIVLKMTHKIEKEPDDGEWYFERGNAFMALGQYSEAAADFGKLIELFPGWGKYYHLRGSCYFHSGDKERALADLRKYKTLESSDHLDDDAMKLLIELENQST